MKKSPAFDVALSFPGTEHPLVEGVALALARTPSADRIFYFPWHLATVPNVDTDVYLADLYRHRSRLVVVFLGAPYHKRRWCRLEWRAIRALIAARPFSVLLFRLDRRPVPGLEGVDAPIDIDPKATQTVAVVAGIIRDRLKLLPSRRRAPQRRRPSTSFSLFFQRDTSEHLVGREKELAMLDATWRDPDTNILSIVAWGGVGKTSLLERWAAQMAKRGWPDTDAVFEWSFYNRSTRTGSVASADLFISSALQFFGDRDASRGSDEEKGRRLAAHIARRRCLLVLDGLEPLQRPPGQDGGRVRDDAVAALLRSLAQLNQGLCLITTRQSVSDLKPFLDSTVREWSLEHLSEAASLHLLRLLGVTGPDEAVRRAGRDLRGHALSVDLLGRYLVQAHAGRIEARRHVRLGEADDRIQGGHAFRVIAAYERWLCSHDEGREQVAALRLLGLFDRPADPAALAALRRRPVISGLTDSLAGLDDAQWNIALQRLQACGLISLTGDETNGGRSADAHPLVREYFNRQLRRDYATARVEAHTRLFALLQRRVRRRRAATLDDVESIFEALVHGCEAGLLEQALAVYRQRLLGGNVGTSRYTVGAFGNQVLFLTYLVDATRHRPVSSLNPGDGAFVMAQLGFCLRAMTRFTEARQWMKAAWRASERQRDWRSACDSAAIHSHLCATTGELTEALRSASRSVALADRSHDAFLRTIMRMTLGNILHYRAEFDRARRAFAEAERLRPPLSDGTRRLRYSLRLFHYHDFLLSDDRPYDVIAGATRALRASVPGQQSELNQALHHVSLGIACRLLHRPDGSGGRILEAESHLDRALRHLKRADRQDDLPYALSARADVRRTLGDMPGAKDDLDEALAITSRAGMNRLAAHCHLSYARLHLSMGQRENARAALDEARTIIERTGYTRLASEAAALGALLTRS